MNQLSVANTVCISCIDVWMMAFCTTKCAYWQLLASGFAYGHQIENRSTKISIVEGPEAETRACADDENF